MKIFKNIVCTVGILLLTTYLKGQGIKSTHPITLVSFKLQHAMRIPNNEVLIFVSLTDTIAEVHVKSKPMLQDAEWAKTALDTSYKLTISEFVQIKNSVLRVAPVDFEKAFVSARNGTYCSITFGNTGNMVTHEYWSPHVKTKERDLERFIEACKLLIRTARLKEKDVL